MSIREIVLRTGVTPEMAASMTDMELLKTPGIGRRYLSELREAAPTVVITRHKGLVEYLIKVGLINSDDKVIEHASPDDVRGRHVVGVLPYSLASLAASITEVALDLPPDLRGVELTLDQVNLYCAGIKKYKVLAQ